MKVYGQIESAQAENLSADPSATGRGRFYFHTSQLVMKLYTSVAWAFMPLRSVKGTLGAPTDIVAATGIVLTADGSDQLHFVKGTGGRTISAVAAISAGKWVGQKLTVKGTSDADWLVIPNGLGTSQNGDWFGGSGDTINYSWDGTNWSEDSRR